MAAVIAVPPASTKLEKKLNFQMSGVIRFLVVLLLFMVAGAALPQDTDTAVSTPDGTQPNELLKPPKISEQQFDQNMQNILNKWNGSYKWQSDNKFGEVLVLQLNQELSSVGHDGQASILKNYIDLKPDKAVYEVVIIIPSATNGVNLVQDITFEPKTHKLLIMKSDTSGSKPYGTEWDDATYTSIVNAIETNDFTNDPGKMSFIES